jgi:hypothetical protein
VSVELNKNSTSCSPVMSNVDVSESSGPSIKQSKPRVVRPRANLQADESLPLVVLDKQDEPVEVKRRVATISAADVGTRGRSRVCVRQEPMRAAEKNGLWA